MRKLKKMPVENKLFETKLLISNSQYQLLISGLRSGGMDDRWIIEGIEGWFYFYRSWNGNCIYKIKIEEKDSRFYITNILINRLEEEYKYSQDEAELKKFQEILSLFFEKKLSGYYG